MPFSIAIFPMVSISLLLYLQTVSNLSSDVESEPISEDNSLLGSMISKSSPSLYSANSNHINEKVDVEPALAESQRLKE